MGIGKTAVLVWMASFWVVAALALIGSRKARDDDDLQLPLLGPVFACVVLVVLTYGQPLHHTPGDLGLVVLASLGYGHASRLIRRWRRKRLERS
jgi:hypothetical protein